MSNRIFFALCAVLAIAFTALAAVTPQGLGARSPGPFGKPVVKPPPTAAEAAAAAALAGLRKSQ
jgi:hypothetical protein